LTVINDVISPSRNLFDVQQRKLVKIDGEFAGTLQEMKNGILNETLKSKEGMNRLVDCVGGEEEVTKLLETCRGDGGNLHKAISEIESLVDTAVTEVHRNLIPYEEELDALRQSMDEANRKIEAIKLFLDHTDKWKAASENQISDLEWEFVLDEYQQVHTSCAEDIVKAHENALRVLGVWHKCDEQSSNWNSLADCLNLILDYRSHLLKAIRVQIPILAQQVLDHQGQLDKIDAIMGLPNMYKQYLKAATTRGSFERFTARVVEHFENKREVARLKLASFQETHAENPLKHLFSTPIVNPSSLVSVHVVPADLEFAGFVGDEDEDDDFNIIVSEDTTALVRENAKIMDQLKQLVDNKRNLQDKQEQVQPLLQFLDNKHNKEKKKEQIQVVDNEEEKMMQFVSVEDEKEQAKEIDHLNELLAAQNNEIEEQKVQNNKLAMNLKEREEERVREINEYSAKLAQSVEFLETRARNIQNEYEIKVQSKDQEILLLKQQLQNLAVTKQQENELRKFHQNNANQQQPKENKNIQELQEQIKALQNYKAKSQEYEKQIAQMQEQQHSKEQMIATLKGEVEQKQGQEQGYQKEIQSLKSTIEQIQQALDSNERATQELDSRLALLLSMIPSDTLHMLNFASTNNN